MTDLVRYVVIDEIGDFSAEMHAALLRATALPPELIVHHSPRTSTEVAQRMLDYSTRMFGPKFSPSGIGMAPIDHVVRRSLTAEIRRRSRAFRGLHLPKRLRARCRHY